MIPFQVICCYPVALFHVVGVIGVIGVIAVITVMTVSAVILFQVFSCYELLCCCSVILFHE